MSYVLDTVSTDIYQYLECPGSRKVTLQISNASVLVGFGSAADALTFRPGAATYPPDDEPFLPVVGSVARRCDEIRVRSYAPGVAANVKVVAQ